MAVITIVMQQSRGNCVSVGIVMEQFRGINVWVETVASIVWTTPITLYLKKLQLNGVNIH
jgi:hypothetical protein